MVIKRCLCLLNSASVSLILVSHLTHYCKTDISCEVQLMMAHFNTENFGDDSESVSLKIQFQKQSQEKKAGSTTSKRVKPRDYREWDR